ncbi:alpha/beta fold hydrolase [Hymenobacter sp. BT491]|uniref:alpha/beta fold hydrolase n=1 Tax=Hymenobacter sp. BT491 TaxID=2766779 RepID=UPI001653D6C4|nr:alpha/beta hydrolase [Hymenobacter sp. BT491]MBC6990963.1 alpha/beta hydrolase [Hymenobacter sp. BT491]
MPQRPALVFLHGFAESREVWAEFVQGFPKQYKLLLLDLLGFGDNYFSSNDLSMEAQAEHVAEQLHIAGVEKAVLIGHSMGGYVALAFAEKYPAQVAGLCLFHSSAQADTGAKRANRDKNIHFVERHGVEKFMGSFIRPLLAPANRDRLAHRVAFLEDIAKSASKETIVNGMRAMRDRPDRTHVLREATFPVLFIVGKEDVAVSLEASLEQVALPPNSTALFLADVGHMGYFEQPDETRRAVLELAKASWGL